MTSQPDRNTLPAEQIPPYCRTCRRALTRRVSPGGGVDFLHAAEQRGEHSDHPARPAPLTEITDPIIECDFCSAPAAWIHICADQQTDTRIVTSRTVDLRDYRRRHHAARTRRVETAAGPVQRWGQRWSACQRCSTLIETRDKRAVLHWLQPFDSVSMSASGPPEMVSGICGGWIHLGQRDCLNDVALSAS